MLTAFTRFDRADPIPEDSEGALTTDGLTIDARKTGEQVIGEIGGIAWIVLEVTEDAMIATEKKVGVRAGEGTEGLIVGEIRDPVGNTKASRRIRNPCRRRTILRRA